MIRAQIHAPASRPILTGDYPWKKPTEHTIRHQARLPPLLETSMQDDSGYGNSAPSSHIFNSYEQPSEAPKPRPALSPQTYSLGKRPEQRVKFHIPPSQHHPAQFGLLAIKNYPSQTPTRSQYPMDQTWPQNGPINPNRPLNRYQPLSLDVRAPRPARHRREVSFADELEVELPPRAKSFQESLVPSMWRDMSLSPRPREELARNYRYLPRGESSFESAGYPPAELGLPLLEPHNANRRIDVNQNRKLTQFFGGTQRVFSGYRNTSLESQRGLNKEIRMRQHSHQDLLLPGYRVNETSPVSTLLSPSNALLDLSSVDQFALFEISTSALGWAEMFMGANWLDQTKQYKFVVLDRHEELLYIGVEESSCISECVVSPYRSSFKVRILDASGRDVIQLHRVYPVKPNRAFGFGQKRKYRLEVSSPPGHIIGNVEKTYDSDNYYLLEDKTGETVFFVQRSCICTCPIFWDYEFKVLLPETDAEVGDVSWSYLSAHNEQLNGTEISFPVDLDPNSKIMLLGACFLLNFGRWPSSYLESIYSPRKSGKQRKENSHQGKKDD